MVTELVQWTGIDYLVNPQKRMYWGYLLLSALIAIAYVRWTRVPLSRVFGLQVWWHPSARLDYAYFIVASLIKLSLILPLVISMREVAFWVINTLEAWFGYLEKINLDDGLLILLYTTALFVFSDFTRYWLHRLMHRVPWLWEFHKVHHSAEVLTPVTFYRVHPVENLLFGFRYALSAGIVTGVFVYLFGAGLDVAKVLGVNLFVFVAHVVGDNLRHSPIRLRYPDWLERVFISPAQHQYHHTLGGSRSNSGGVLACWDYWFGSLRLSRARDDYLFGVDDPHHFQSIPGLLLSPVLNILRPLITRLGYAKLG